MAQARLECSVKKHPRESARWKTLTFWPFSWPTVYNSVWDVDLIASIHLREGLFLLAWHAQVFHAFPCRQYNSYLLGCSNCTDTAAGPYLASFTWGNYMCAPCWAVFCRHRNAQVLRASRRGGVLLLSIGTRGYTDTAAVSQCDNHVHAPCGCRSSYTHRVSLGTHSCNPYRCHIGTQWLCLWNCKSQ